MAYEQAVGSNLLWAQGVVSLVKESFVDINGLLLRNRLLHLSNRFKEIKCILYAYIVEK